MKAVPRILALVGVFLLASVAWIALGGVMTGRTSAQRSELVGDVAELWGETLTQRAPSFTFEHAQVREREETVTAPDGKVSVRRIRTDELVTRPITPDASRITVDLRLDQRRKGLVWFPLYDVDFAGTWTCVHAGPESGTLAFAFPFPTDNGVYDDFRLEVDGEPRAGALDASDGVVRVQVPVQPGREVTFTVAFRSRGMDTWTYRPSDGVGEIRDFDLTMTTDFTAIDYPPYTMSPSTRDRVGPGWRLGWTSERLVSGHGIGMVMPTRVQPGELGARMSFSAPISLGFFMTWIYVLGLLRGREVHPVNHLFLAAAFFSFHLLFAYTADHLPVEAAFALSAATSVVLVVSYLRIVVGPRFAFVEAGLAQLLYLVGFSLAHVWTGFTGLTVTVLGVLTLFALMQLTARIRWAEVLGGAAPDRPPIRG